MQFCSVDTADTNGNFNGWKNVIIINNIIICYYRPIANHVYNYDIERVC